MSDADNPTPESTPDSPPQPEGRRGGPDFHKPGCKCNACVARRRKAEAVARGAGLPAPIPPVDPDSEVIVTDLPIAGKKIERHRIKMWLQWKALEPKLTHADAAARLDIAPQTLTNLIHKATKEGWLQFQNPMDELEYEILPKVTHNLKYYLDQGDKDVTVKTAQGTLFKQFLANKGIQETPTTVLALKIEMPEGIPADATNSIKGIIVGSPRTIEADLVKDESDE